MCKNRPFSRKNTSNCTLIRHEIFVGKSMPQIEHFFPSFTKIKSCDLWEKGFVVVEKICITWLVSNNYWSDIFHLTNNDLILSGDIDIPSHQFQKQTSLWLANVFENKQASMLIIAPWVIFWT